MATKSNAQQLREDIVGQQLGLALAAHLARTQLLPDPTRVYDGQHLSEMLNVIAVALARTAPMYVMDAVIGEPRPLAPGELDGAAAKASATLLVLKDGRDLAGVSIRRRLAPSNCHLEGGRVAGTQPAPSRARRHGFHTEARRCGHTASPGEPARRNGGDTQAASATRAAGARQERCRLYRTTHAARPRRELSDATHERLA
jgi:hypothetical protein